MRQLKRFVCILAFLSICLPLLALERQPNADYRARRVQLSKNAGGIVILFAAVEGEGREDLFGFRQDDYFYYLTGWPEPGAALMIAPELAATADKPARPYTEVLFLPAHNRVKERWTGPKLAADSSNAKSETGFDRVETLDAMRTVIDGLMMERKGKILTDVASGTENSPSTVPMQWLQRANAFPGGSFTDVKPLIDDMRAIKDAGEIALVREAMENSAAGHAAAMKAMKPGMKEYEIASLIQYEYKRRGCERDAYAPIVGSGINSTVLHYSDNSKTIEPGDLVVMDVGAECSMYASDITRTLPASGKFTARQREIYDIVLGAQRAAITAFVPGKSVLLGNSPDSLYKVALDYINAHGKDLHGQPLGKYFIHGLGHPVGLEVHDTKYTVLDKGSVFTIEPGIYIPEEKIGVRIEDTFAVDQNGKLVNLSANLPHTADEVEAAMKH